MNEIHLRTDGQLGLGCIPGQFSWHRDLVSAPSKLGLNRSPCLFVDWSFQRRSYNFSFHRIGLPQFLLVALLGLDFGDLPQGQHAIGQSRQCRDVIGDDRGHDPKAQCKDTADACDIGSQDQLPAAAYVTVEVTGNIAEVAESGEPFLEEDDIGCVGGDRRSSTKRNRNVGLLECN